MKLPTFRDFVVLYIAEGYKRDRNRVQIANSDDRVIAMAASWLTSLTSKWIEYSVHYHADQDLDELRTFWGACSESTALRSRCFENPTAVS